MALTTHEKIRTESGFQNQFVRQAFLNSPDGSASTFYVNSDDNVKFVPNFNTGNTIAGISDIQVWLGLSGIYGVTRLGVSAIDIDQGSVRLSVTPTNGSSLIISYASSPITSDQIEDVRKNAENIINQRLALCYNIPLSTVPSSISTLAARLAAALLLIRNYGYGSRDTASDGYALYEQLMGANQGMINLGTDSESANVGEVGKICSINFKLIDDDGNEIPRNDSEELGGSSEFIVGGRVRGRLYDITEEGFRFKPFQEDVNSDQSGSGI